MNKWILILLFVSGSAFADQASRELTQTPAMQSASKVIAVAKAVAQHPELQNHTIKRVTVSELSHSVEVLGEDCCKTIPARIVLDSLGQASATLYVNSAQSCSE